MGLGLVRDAMMRSLQKVPAVNIDTLPFDLYDTSQEHSRQLGRLLPPTNAHEALPPLFSSLQSTAV